MTDLSSALDAEVGRPSTEAGGNVRPIRIFISYSSQDVKFKDALCVHLAERISDRLAEVWADHRLKPGDHWSEELKEEIKQADIALVLVSNKFLGSEFIKSKELPWLSEQDREGTLCLIPLVLRKDANWKPLLGELHALRRGKAIQRVNNTKGWSEAVDEIAQLCRSMRPGDATSRDVAECEPGSAPTWLQTFRDKVRTWVWVLPLVLAAAAVLGSRWLIGQRSFNECLDEAERALDRGDRLEAGNYLSQPPTGWGAQADAVRLGTDTIQLYGGGKDWKADRFMRRVDSLLDRSKRLKGRFQAHILTARASFRLYAWQLDEAERDYTAAVRVRNTLVEAWLGLGTVHLWRKDSKRALEELKRGLEYAPESAELKAAVGAAYADMGDHEKAVEKYEEARRDKADYLPAYWEPARIYRQNGKPAKAAEILRAGESYLNAGLPLGGRSAPLGYRVNEETAHVLTPLDDAKAPPPVILLTSNERIRYYFHLSAATTACLVKDPDWKKDALQGARRLVLDHAVGGNSKQYAELLLGDELPSAERAADAARQRFCIFEVLRDVAGW